MKYLKFIPLIFLSLFLINCGKPKDNSFSIKGHINNNFNDYIYLKYNNIVDSTLVKNNIFTFKGRISQPKEAILFPYNPSSKKMMGLASFMLENSSIKIYLNYDKSYFRGKKTRFIKTDSIFGSKSQDLKNSFNLKMKNTFYKEKNDSIKKIILYNNLNQFIKTNPKSVLSGRFTAFLNNFYKGYLNSKQLENLYQLLDTTYQEKNDLESIKNIIDRRRKLKIGNTIPNFSLPNKNGTLIKSTSFKNKYLLLEFWASWCIPCRDANPKLQKVYSSFKNENFEILGVSIDKNPNNWQKAVKKDAIKWIQVIDTLNITEKMFNITRIPYNILLDKEGKIVARNIKPKKLNAILVLKLHNN